MGAFGGALPGDRQLSVTGCAGVTCEMAQAGVRAGGCCLHKTSCRGHVGSAHTSSAPSGILFRSESCSFGGQTTFQNFLADLPSPPFLLLGARKATGFFLGVPEVTFQQRKSLVSGTRVEAPLS